MAVIAEEHVSQIVPLPTPKQPLSILDAALLAHRSGLCVLPPREDGSKAPMAPAGRWKHFQRQRPTEEDIRRWYGPCTGIGIVCGKVSRHLEMLEFEGRAVAEGLWQEFNNLADQTVLRDLVDRIKHGYGERTPSGGHHLLYRCLDGVEGSLKLAERPPTEEEAADDVRSGGKPTPRVLIETRGQGGYVVVAPSGGRVHQTGLDYRLVYGGFDTIVTITAAERAALLELARSLDRMPRVGVEPGPEARNDTGRPGDDFAARTSWAEILEPHGWRPLFIAADGNQHWRRPGKDRGTSATVNEGGAGVLYVFSTSTDFDAERAYSKFAAYAVLNHNGDFAAAARALRAQGYGQQDGRTDGRRKSEVDGPPLAADGFACTDVGNAERLVHRYSDHLRHVPAWGWLAWDGRRWARNDARPTQLAISTVREMHRAARRAETVEEQIELKGWAKRSEAQARLEAMLSIAARLQPIASAADQFDRDPWLFNCRNGTIELRTGELRPHQQDDGITRLAPVEYRPDARYEPWERFLEEVTAGQASMSEFLQRAIGYTLTGDTSEEYVFIAHGGAGRGKTTFLEAVAAAMGDYAGSIRIEVLTDSGRTGSGHNEDIARLAGRRLVTAVEASEGERLREGLFKSLTGGDTIPASLKNKPVFDFTPTFKLWMATNHVPRMRADDEGLRRRVVKLPFDNPPAQKDRALKRRLRTVAEARQAVLAWAVRGCLEWQRSELKPPPSISEATHRLWEDMDQVGQFFDDCLVFDDACRTPSRELQGAYEAWAEEQGVSFRFRVSFKRVTERLRSQGCEGWKDGHGQRFWLGVGLAHEGAAAASTALRQQTRPPHQNRTDFGRQPETGAVPAVGAVEGGLSSSKSYSNGVSALVAEEAAGEADSRAAARSAMRAREGSQQLGNGAVAAVPAAVAAECRHPAVTIDVGLVLCNVCGATRRPPQPWSQPDAVDLTPTCGQPDESRSTLEVSSNHAADDDWEVWRP